METMQSSSSSSFSSSSSSTPQHYSQYALLMISGGQTLAPGGEDTRGALTQVDTHRRTKPGAVLNRQRPPGTSSPPRQLLRCVKKKRTHPDDDGTDFVDFFPVASVARRNERERNRVRQVNAGFQTLRQHVPNGAANGKLSKVETLRSAVEYIRALQRLLLLNSSRSVFENMEEEEEEEEEEVPESPPSSAVSTSSGGGGGGGGLSAGPESPRSTCSSSEQDAAGTPGYGTGLSRSEEPELLDFTAWLHRYTELLNN